jgi:hypothetical protein
MNDRRGPWYLLTGLVIGLAIGLVYAWVIRPVQFTNTFPSTLRADYKDRYRALIAAAYMADNNLVTARARLDLLQDQDLYGTLAEQAQRTLAEGKSPQEARALGLLAVALGQAPAKATAFSPATPGGPSVTVTAASTTPLPVNSLLTATVTSTVSSGAIFSLTIQTPTVRVLKTTQLPTATDTPLPTRTPVPTPAAPFVLASKEKVCDPNLSAPLIQVQAQNADGQAVPGVEVIVNWGTSEENHFFTGLKPELGQGYADFTMTPGVVYTLRLAGGGQPIPDLAASECEATNGDRYWGSWLLLFGQP